jgi:class 3 adenylate cyclase/predicted ATPase
MRCSKCGSDNPAGNNFCAQCGSALARICARCKAENASDSRFCGTCGAPLNGVAASLSPPAEAAADLHLMPEQPDAEPASDGERKTVTALFADIKGSTALEEKLDPEEARAIVDPALKLMIDAVHQYDGYIVQSTGDGIFALFGAPLAHEDHPQRSLYAALRMQDGLLRYSTGLREAGSPPIEARIGVNTGEVVVRSITTGAGHTEYTPIGHTANLASRMQAIAPTGSIAVTDATRKLCEGYFSFRALGPTRVKGLSQPVEVHEVTGLGPLRTRLQRAAGRGLTRFVGRERESAELRRALELVRQGRGQIAAAIGEAGLGKSRLFFEFKATAQAGCLVLEAFSVSHGKAAAYVPVIELLDNYFEIEAGDDARRRREKITGKVLALDRTLEDTLPYLFTLLGMEEMAATMAGMDPQVRRRHTLDAIKRILLRESLNQPVIVIFEDLHWIDQETQALLNLLADSIGTAKILMLVNYRPEYRHEWGSRTYYTQLRLDPLGPDSADQLLTALLGAAPELPAVRRAIIERSEGNPFFIEELVQTLFDEGVLIRNGTIAIARPLAETRLPATVQGVLAARIDRLPPPEKDLLQTLAVIGREFPLGLVRKVAEHPPVELEAMLAHLQSAEFIYEQPALADLEYTFKHALTREVAYGSLLGERRKLLHQRIARAIEQSLPALAEARPELLAEHFGLAGLPDPASRYRERAGDLAAIRCAYPEAIAHFNAGLDEAARIAEGPDRARRQLALLLKLGPVLLFIKGPQAPEFEDAYIRARAIAEELGEGTELFKAIWGLWLSASMRQTETAPTRAEELVALGARLRDDDLLLEALHCRWSTAFFRGDTWAAVDDSREGIERYDRERHSRLGAMFGGHDPGVCAHAVRGLGFCVAGALEQARESVTQAVRLAELLEHPPSLAHALSDAAITWQIAGDRAASDDMARRTVELADKYSLAHHRVIGRFLSGWSQAAAANTPAGLTQMESAFAHVSAVAALRLYFTAVLAEVLARAGRAEAALALLDQALAAVKEPGVGFYLSEVHRLRGECLMMLAAGNRDAALRSYDTALEVASQHGATLLQLRAATSRARLWMSAGQPESGLALLREIYASFTENFDAADLVAARALLDRHQ